MPRPILYAALVAWIAVVCMLAVVEDVRLAVLALAAVMAGMALLRAVLPTGMLPTIRGRFWDTVTLLLFAFLLYQLAEWGNAPVV